VSELLAIHSTWITAPHLGRVATRARVSTRRRRVTCASVRQVCCVRAIGYLLIFVQLFFRKSIYLTFVQQPVAYAGFNIGDGWQKGMRP